MATNLYYHFDCETYSDLLDRMFKDRDISDENVNKLLSEAENTTNGFLTFEEDVKDSYFGIDCFSESDNQMINDLLSNTFLDVYFMKGNIDKLLSETSVTLDDVSFEHISSDEYKNSFESIVGGEFGNTAIFCIDSRDLAPLFKRNSNDGVIFDSRYMFGYYDQQTGNFVKNLNYVDRPAYEGDDISFDSYIGEYNMPIMSENPLINELYRKLYSLEVLFCKYVDDKGFEDLKNQIKYYASSIVSLKQSISEDMVKEEASKLETEMAM